jgi:hypothetical protein
MKAYVYITKNGERAALVCVAKGSQHSQHIVTHPTKMDIYALSPILRLMVDQAKNFNDVEDFFANVAKCNANKDQA